MTPPHQSCPRKHPYRSAPATTTNQHSIPEPESLDDGVVTAVLMLVGALGVATGVLAQERTVELSIGLLILVFVAGTFASERRLRHRVDDQDHHDR